MSNPEKSLKGLKSDNPIKIERGRRDETRRRFDRENQDSQQSRDSVERPNGDGSVDDLRRRLNARYEVVSEDFKRASRKLSEVARQQTNIGVNMQNTIDRSIDVMFRCIYTGELEKVKTTLNNLKRNSPSTYIKLKQTVDERCIEAKQAENEAKQAENKEIWDAIGRVFSEERGESVLLVPELTQDTAHYKGRFDEFLRLKQPVIAELQKFNNEILDTDDRRTVHENNFSECKDMLIKQYGLYRVKKLEKSYNTIKRLLAVEQETLRVIESDGIGERVLEGIRNCNKEYEKACVYLAELIAEDAEDILEAARGRNKDALPGGEWERLKEQIKTLKKTPFGTPEYENILKTLYGQAPDTNTE